MAQLENIEAIENACGNRLIPYAPTPSWPVTNTFAGDGADLPATCLQPLLIAKRRDNRKPAQPWR